ncbi:MAG: hypothetical protein JWP37_1148 [Mucilaginibacter sp.]|nr:hypothetical protein [Mucilaginibacter sp.]
MVILLEGRRVNKISNKIAVLVNEASISVQLDFS